MQMFPSLSNNEIDDELVFGYSSRFKFDNPLNPSSRCSTLESDVKFSEMG